ncbi:disulfide bond formation protein B [Paraferrimonas sp. SM1919]|uniref:disulfide bond formation protein B n=1 Tax=Paraferrimonas sp. SM1919 TaxID=2662263 RepID=UPI0013D7F5B3|nr:disulfide bond formation protein B [Paraferrimonas sp. SM1919]
MLVVSKTLTSRKSYALLLGLSGFLFIAALFSQHVLNYQPCINCVYQRLAMVMIMLSAIIAMVAPHSWLIRNLAFSIWGTAAIWGSIKAWELYQLHADPNPFSFCSFFPEFWLPLEQWLPQIFQPTGGCTDPVYSVFGLSMVQWSLVAFICFTVAWAIFIIPSLLQRK